ncbi:hypothetical protein Rhe02_25700 [Rhizocola hellebori]|uniref:DUF1684 domain-containing protein n=1 Tax=Rhizocola hellebori TaxID=1392758 RepID=A0A8J3Q5P5_9ACTN|nr:DUF1684 domain-containing protein [Rhizocola hellebori]GIH04503.1 hypothetical protein Rhe02_25700 [Rhizocola hellebori]
MDHLELALWRERVAQIHLSDLDLEGFRRAKDELFATHPQSPVDPAGFTGLRYFPPTAELIFEAAVHPAQGTIEIDTGDTDGVVSYTRAGLVQTPLGPLTLWWVKAYGGGLFLPFRDNTCGVECYGGGRYLTDTVKGTFGRGVTVLGPARVRLDFNYAYNPSCAYSDAWVCPLAPRENWLDARIAAGEMNYHG